MKKINVCCDCKITWQVFFLGNYPHIIAAFVDLDDAIKFVTLSKEGNDYNWGDGFTIVEM